MNTVRAAEQKFGRAVGFIIIDTYAKGVAAGGGDEDKARDANRAAANLRRIYSLIDVHIALVGHTGKDESRGARGSNAHLGDVDIMVQIGGDGIKFAEVVKANDAPLGVIAQFKLVPFEVGRDVDGDFIGIAIVAADQINITRSALAKKKDRLTEKQRAALRALNDTIADGNIAPIPADEHVPKSVTSGTSFDQWRVTLEKRAVINAKGSPREEMKRLHATLYNRGFIGIWGDFVWPVTGTSRHM